MDNKRKIKLNKYNEKMQKEMESFTSEDFKKIDLLEKRLSYRFKNKEYILNAITHKSYAHEHDTKYNERLEFLGDSILGFTIAERLFNLDKIDEGQMSKQRAYIVCEDSLYEIASKLGMVNILRYGGGEKNVPQKAVLADSIEAIIAAIYLDSNIKTVKKIILRLFSEKIKEAHVEKIVLDYKSTLQEIIQQSPDAYNLEYIHIGETGPDHDKIFEVWVTINDVKMAKGKGKTKKAAEMDAARLAIEKLKEIERRKNENV